MARAATTASSTIDISDWSIIKTLARAERIDVSVGLKAVLALPVGKLAQRSNDLGLLIAQQHGVIRGRRVPR